MGRVKMADEGGMDFLNGIRTNYVPPYVKSSKKKPTMGSKQSLRNIHILFYPNGEIQGVYRCGDTAKEKLMVLNSRYKGEFTLKPRIVL